MLRRLFGLCLILSGLSSSVWAQATSVQGHITDAETGLALVGVNVVLEQDETIVAGGITDAEGAFALADIALGVYDLVIRYVGYETYREALTVTVNLPRLELALTPAVLALDEVEVSPFEAAAGVEGAVSAIRIQPELVRGVAGADQDVLRTLQALPGVVSSSDYSSQLIIRGGGPDQNLVVVDQIEVFNPYRLYGIVSMFNPATVRDLQLSTGGFSAQYGDRLSSVLVVNSRAGSPNQTLGGEVNLGLSNLNLVLEGKTGFWNGGWLLSARRTYFDLIGLSVSRGFGLIEDDFSFPSFGDIQGQAVLRPNAKNILRFNGIVSRDQLKVFSTGTTDTGGNAEDTIGARDLTRNDAAGLTWTYTPNAQFSARTFANWYHNIGDGDFAGELAPRDQVTGGRLVASVDSGRTLEFTYDQQYNFRKFALGHESTYQVNNHTFSAGAGVDFLRTALEFSVDMNEQARLIFNSLQSVPYWSEVIADQINQATSFRRYHFYAQDEWALWDRLLILRPGVRFDYYDHIGRAYISPRFNFSLALDENTAFRAAWGIYRQSPGYEKLLTQGDFFSLSTPPLIENLRAETATHYIVGLSRTWGRAWHMRIEAYWKTFRDLIVQEIGMVNRLVGTYNERSGFDPANPFGYILSQEQQVGLTSRAVNEGGGTAQGLEILFEKRRTSATDRWTGWVSYALSHTRRTRDLFGTGFTVPFDYDRPHVVNAALNYQFNDRWQVAATWRYGTGFPTTPAVDFEPITAKVIDPLRPDEALKDVILTDEDGNVRFVPYFGGPENVNAERYPDYHRLDLRVTYEATLLDRPWDFYLDLINVYNRRNVHRYHYFIVYEERSPAGLPGAIRKRPTPVMYRGKAYMFPFLPSIGLRVNF